MATATLTTKGQITIPLEVRKKLGLGAGDRIDFFHNDQTGRYEICPANVPLMSLFGALPKPKHAVTVEEMNETIRERRAARSQR